jgi:hypothetical protein
LLGLLHFPFFHFIYSSSLIAVAVVIAFFICWAPFHAQRLLYVYAKDSPNYREINEKMFFVTGINHHANG